MIETAGSFLTFRLFTWLSLGTAIQFYTCSSVYTFSIVKHRRLVEDEIRGKQTKSKAHALARTNRCLPMISSIAVKETKARMPSTSESNRRFIIIGAVSPRNKLIANLPELKRKKVNQKRIASDIRRRVAKTMPRISRHIMIPINWV